MQGLFSPYDTKNAPLRIALRRSGRMSLKRPAAGGESCKQDSFSFLQFWNSIASGCNQQKNMLPWIYVIDVKLYRHVNAYETGESRTRYRGCICPAFFWLHAQLPKSP